MKAALYALVIVLVTFFTLAGPVRALADEDWGHGYRYENGCGFDGHWFDHDWGHKWLKHHRGKDRDDRGWRFCKHGRNHCGPRPGYRWNTYGAGYPQPKHYSGSVTNTRFPSPTITDAEAPLQRRHKSTLRAG